MHQSTQRRTCRVVFLVGCILPTLAVMAWATYERLPTTAASRLAHIERMLGMHVTAAALETPIPGVMRCRNLELLNIETGEVVLTATLAHLRTDGPKPRVRLSGVTLSEAELPHLAASLHRSLEVDWPGSVSIELANVAWRDSGNPLVEKLLQGHTLTLTLESTEQQGEITGRRCTIETTEAGPRVEVFRNRQISPPATRVVLDTAGEQLPAKWIVALGALVVDGGAEATFAGKVDVIHSLERTSGSLEGELANVALAEALNIPLNTLANFQNLRLHWQAGRITMAEGDVVAGAGSMTGELAKTLERLYQRPQPGAQVANDATVEFGSLGVSFNITGESLTLQPTAESTACIVGSQSQILFGCPTHLVPTPYVGTVLTYFGGDRGVEASACLPRTLQR